MLIYILQSYFKFLTALFSRFLKILFKGTKANFIVIIDTLITLLIQVKEKHFLLKYAEYLYGSEYI